MDNWLSQLQGWAEFALRPAAAISPVFRQQSLLAESEHRPWSLPPGQWFMRQTWCDLLFAHWQVPIERLEAVIPSQLPVDTFDGSAWLGVTPFLVDGLRLRGTTPAPLVSRFPEINVRTYVTVGGKPGIYFLSLDAARKSAVLAARRVYRLPYFHSRMSRRRRGEWVEFCSERISDDGPEARFLGRYRATGKASTASPGSLEHFLTERYCLYTLDERQRILRGEIHHPSWPLRTAEANLEQNTMAAPFGLRPETEPLFHFSSRQDVLMWRNEAI
jgi:uncharacterized protein